MNNKSDEVYMTLLKAKQNIAEYANKKVKNEKWQPYYNGIVEKIDDIIRDIEKSPNIRFLSDDIKHKINDILMIIGDINEQ